MPTATAFSRTQLELMTFTSRELDSMFTDQGGTAGGNGAGRKMSRVSERSTTPTELLLAWGRGEAAALDRLVPLVHDELRRMARRYMGGERPGHTLQATALVNEVYLRLIEVDHVRGQNRAQFFALAAQVMRRILVDFARARGSDKRGGGAEKVSLDDALVISSEPSEDLVALDGALQALARIDPRKSQVVELRYFGGLTLEETAEVLHVSADTVKRDWRFAKLWLLRALTGE
jgi:RNA polymerase sigma-70 factor (ECF subfamily)